jgi:hypothetical protein
MLIKIKIVKLSDNINYYEEFKKKLVEILISEAHIYISKNRILIN